MKNCSRSITPPARARASAAVLAVLALGMAACDTSVINPGPVTDSFLENRAAHQALANGAMVQLADALATVAYTTAAVTREIFPAGSTSAFGISANQQQGRLLFDDEHVSWTSHQRARNVAEMGFARFESIVGAGSIATYRPALDAALWAGYANRLLGEVFCQAVIDGGPAQSRNVFFERAESWFTKAMELAAAQNQANIGTAARAGRASVRASLGNWAGATADAAAVPDAFVFNMSFTNTQVSQYNRTFWAGANRPYRAHTVWNTFYQQYRLDTNDPRTPWTQTALLGDAALGLLGGQRAPFLPQTKHNTEAAPIRLSSGWEMRLLEAEALLVAGNWQAAMPLVNKRRVLLNLQPWPATSLEEAWSMYKRERGIELWLEGRRIADLRRWKESNRPGALHPRETAGDPSSYLRADQTLCYPIPKAEYETNPNLTMP
jgi:starch-binding outer membrane protein, SusD/RagB family